MGVQKKKLLHRIMALAIAVAVGLSVIVPGGTSAEAATIPADVTKPSANCVFIAMKGKYVSEASAAVKRINQIRYEACKQGVKIDGRKLTLDDYVPIKWSAGLEKIARIELRRRVLQCITQDLTESLYLISNIREMAGRLPRCLRGTGQRACSWALSSGTARRMPM